MNIQEIESGMSLRRYELGARPNMQAVYIAEHYASVANIAQDLQKLLDLKARWITQGKPMEHVAEVEGHIERAVAVIKERHAKDFGIPLEWGREKKD